MRQLESNRGFTVVELTVVVLIIGLLATFAFATAGKLLDHARFASCVSNQRNIANAARIFIAESQTSELEFGVEELTIGEWIPKEVGECPSSSDGDSADYKITIAESRVVSVECQIEPQKHHWEHP